jgi:thiol-disulfide isomerase/thioredoxin
MNDQSAAKPRGGVLTWSLWGAAAIGVAAVVYITVQSTAKPPTKTEVATSAPVATAPPTHDVAKKIEHATDGVAAPTYVFRDAKGKPVTAASFKGKIVVLNMWATWCAPCKLEMPMLAKLAAAYAGKPVEVVAVSIDKPDEAAEARTFLAANAPLSFYNDPEAKLPWAITPPANGMPTTIIIGKDGLERGRISGPADWDAPSAKAMIDKLLAAS